MGRVIMTAERCQRAQQMYDAGNSVEFIAEAFGVSKWAVYDHIKTVNGKPRGGIVSRHIDIIPSPEEEKEKMFMKVGTTYTLKGKETGICYGVDLKAGTIKCNDGDGMTFELEFEAFENIVKELNGLVGKFRKMGINDIEEV